MMTQLKRDITTITDPKKLKETVFKRSNTLWENIHNNDDLLNSNMLKPLLDYQYSLLQSVINIHKKEKVKDPLLDHVLNLNDIKGQLNKVVSNHSIYYMDEDTDVYFIGDIHSDAYIIEHLLETINFYDKIIQKIPFKIVFLGDYVDRGKNHIKTVEYILTLKLYFPNHIYLLMGNHDIGHIENGQVTLYLRQAESEMDYFYHYINYLHKHHKDFTDDLLELYLTFMNTLNVTAFITTEKSNIMAVHGGIPRPTADDNFDYIVNHKQLTDDSVDHHNFRIRDNIIWSDPSIQHKQAIIEKKRFKFYEDHIRRFHETFGLDTLVRGHQAIEAGYLELFDGKLYTIFSTGVLNEKENTHTAYDFVTPKILKYKAKKGLPMEVLDVE